MKEFIEKLSSYHLLNYFLPGIVFAFFADKYTTYHMLSSSIWLSLFLYYFIGLVISRIGSLIIEPICIAAKVIYFLPHEKFVKSQRNDDQLSVISETNNMYRSLSSVFLMLILLRIWNIIENRFTLLANFHFWILIPLLFLLFIFSYRKQTKYITSRMSTK